MSKRKLTLLLVALVIAITTAMVARVMVSNKPADVQQVAAPEAAPQIMEVLVAAKDLPAGTLLKADDMKWQVWPKDETATGLMVKDKETIESMTGAVVRQGMRAGEPLMQARVVRKRDQGFMAAVLNPGMRAISVSLTPTGGVAGFVFPGDHVDVLVTHQVGGKGTDMSAGGHRVAETLMRDVRVLALDQQASDQMTEPKVAKIATLEVSPSQAEAIAVASDMGSISLALRSLETEPGDVQTSQKDQASDDMAVAAKELLPPGAVPMPSQNGGSAYTWDSDVSRVIHGPNNRSGSVQRVQIMRGKETTEATFDLK